MFLVNLKSLEGYERYVRLLGGNPVLLLRKAGLSSAQIDTPNAYAAYTTVAEALEVAALDREEPLFSLGLSHYQPLIIVRDLVLTLTQQPTLRDALEMMSRYAYLQAGGVSVTLREVNDRCHVEFHSLASSRLGLTQKIQLSVGQLSRLVAELLGLESPSFPLCLQQRAPQTTRINPELFQRIRFDAAFDGLDIPVAWLSRKPKQDDSAIKGHFDTLVAALQQNYPDNLEDQVRSIMGNLLPTGECTVDNVARSLDMTARTLQKKLKENGSSFTSLLHQVRADIAKQYLSATNTSVTKLALQLGYADVAVFSRQFKGWTGNSPKEWQKLHQQGNSGKHS